MSESHEPFNISKIKINYLGYPGTMGTENYDYIIADKNIIPKKYNLQTLNIKTPRKNIFLLYQKIYKSIHSVNRITFGSPLLASSFQVQIDLDGSSVQKVNSVGVEYRPLYKRIT